MYNLQKVINGIEFKLSFSHKVNVIKGNSGTGKSFIFEVILNDNSLNGVPVVLIDYRTVVSGNKHLIVEMCRGKQIVLLDNADLYLTPELFAEIRAMDNMIIMSKKSTWGLDMRDACQYMIRYSGDCVEVKEV